jgi:hypothetical protein
VKARRLDDRLVRRILPWNASPSARSMWEIHRGCSLVVIPDVGSKGIVRGLGTAHCPASQLISVPIVLFGRRMKAEKWVVRPGLYVPPPHYERRVRSSIPAGLRMLRCHQPSGFLAGKNQPILPLFARSYQGFMRIVKEAFMRKKVGHHHAIISCY